MIITYYLFVSHGRMMANNVGVFTCGKTEKITRFRMLEILAILQVPTTGRWQMTFAPHGSLPKPCHFFRFSVNYFLIIIIIIIVDYVFFKIFDSSCMTLKHICCIHWHLHLFPLFLRVPAICITLDTLTFA